MRKIIFFLLTTTVTFQLVFAQQPKKYTSSEIYEAVQKLNFLGSALYIAAHPDDENTRLISYLSNEVKARTAYLSITRGDGGQNLIGTELSELLGVLRTQELLAARRIDGGEQLFTRANDFGFSKHPDETLEIWNKNEVLHDVVWAIRKFKPDVVINRFDHRSPGTTHGHHTSSAMLSIEAFDIVNDKKAFPGQLQFVDNWQPKRLFFNTTWWFYGSMENFEKADKSKMVYVDIGTYYPLKGTSNNEIAAQSRSQHLSQGFGSIGSRGSELEYLELIKGDLPNNKSNLFDGINTTWSRVKGGEKIGDILNTLESNFNFLNPSAHIPELIKAYELIEKLEDGHWEKIKSEEIKNIISACSGLYLEAVTEIHSATPGDSLKINVEAINRSSIDIELKDIEILPLKNSKSINEKLADNERKNYEVAVKLNETKSYSAPYWLTEPGTLGMYKVTDKQLIGKPETPAPVSTVISVVINGTVIPFTKEVIFKYSKPDKGEIYEPFEILPEVSAGIADKVNIFADSTSKNLPVKIKANRKNLSGTVSLSYPDGWKVSPESIDFTIEKNGDEKTVIFKVTPPEFESEGIITPMVHVNGNVYTKELIAINYDHIPKQSVLLPSEVKVVRLNIKKAGENIGYIMGAGDAVPESLRQIGYNVIVVNPIEIEAGSLDEFDAVVMGIRAYNVIDALKFKQRHILNYVEGGGNLIIQYNTVGWGGLNFENLSPYKLQVSRDRVTDETAAVRFLSKGHSLLNFPNVINKKDFNGWVQERGLYFPNEWGEEFTPVLSINDKGEDPKNGSLLVAQYGKGYYIYTGLSFFRELPAGVAGAYKLFANMLSIGKPEIKLEENFKG